MICEVCEGSLLVTGPVRTSHLKQHVIEKRTKRPRVNSHLTESASLLMPMDCVDVTSLRAASVSPVARMLYPLDYRGCHLNSVVIVDPSQLLKST